MPGSSGTAVSSALGLAMIVWVVPCHAEPLPFSAYAEDTDATITRLVGEIELFRFTDDQLAIIKSLAYQEGVAVVCPGFETDESSRIDVLAQIVPMRDEDFRAATLEQVALRSEVMFAFGTHFGATVAIGKADPAAFCTRADQDRQDPALIARIWVQKQ